MKSDRKWEGEQAKKKWGRKAGNVVFFAVVMCLTFYTVLHGQDWHQIGSSLRQLSVPYLLLILVTALFFVCAEGGMIWYLLRTVNPGGSGLLRCISYSFIGFFYSGITPSATGGQPMQLYYMKKDGNSLSDSSVVLMTVALVYKFDLVLIGSAMLLFWRRPLQMYLQGYFGLYLLGLGLNVVLVVVLLAVMLMPEGMQNIICRMEGILVRKRLLKASEPRREKLHQFVDGYRNAVQFLRKRRGSVCLVILITFLQRCSVFLLTGFVYLGFAQKGTDFVTVVLLQASVIIAVDMLPLPGAQGISEWMYCHIFSAVFSEAYLMPSLYVTRGVSFYFLLIVSLLVAGGNQIYRSKKV